MPYDQLYFILVGAYTDEVEAGKPAGERDSLTGFERKEIGGGHLFGEEIELIAAGFKAGDVYGTHEGETSRFVKFEVSYEF